MNKHKEGSEGNIKNLMEQELKLEMKMENKGKEVEYLDIKIFIQQNGMIQTKWNKKICFKQNNTLTFTN